MDEHPKGTVVCQICGKTLQHHDAYPGHFVREAVVETIRKHHPDWSPNGYICRADRRRFQSEYVKDAIAAERGELTSLDEQVLDSLRDEEILARDVNAEFQSRQTVGQRLADRMAEMVGSWRFISTFTVVLLVWITLNSIHALRRPFDPYPYILLNLVLSCVAAIQAPIIMMSQNRQEAKDRLRAEHDYRVNLKAEIEIRALHGKIDELITHQWQRLLEIQEIQTEMLQEQTRKKE
jgi:uncharacterized membrane protein